MKQLTLLLGLVLILSSCTSSSTNCAPNIGDLIEYSVVVDSGSTVAPNVAYYNSTSQIEHYYFPSDSICSWSISFSTTEANQYLYVSAAASSGIGIHSCIRVNSVLVEEGTGSSGVVIHCN